MKKETIVQFFNRRFWALKEGQNILLDTLVEEYRGKTGTTNDSEALRRSLVKSIRKHISEGILPAQLFFDTNVVRIAKNSTQQYHDACMAADPHAFANHVGTALLECAGCFSRNIHITPNQKDGGYDYWGIHYPDEKAVALGIQPTVFIGEVKRHSGSISAEMIRAFYGAASAAIKSDALEGIAVTEGMMVVLQYVTTAPLTSAAEAVSKQLGVVPIYTQTLEQLNIEIPA